MIDQTPSATTHRVDALMTLADGLLELGLHDESAEHFRRALTSLGQPPSVSRVRALEGLAKLERARGCVRCAADYDGRAKLARAAMRGAGD